MGRAGRASPLSRGSHAPAEGARVTLGTSSLGFVLVSLESWGLVRKPLLSPWKPAQPRTLPQPQFVLFDSTPL